MIRYQITQRVRRPAAAVYDFCVVHQPENHPKWEAEVMEVRREGPAVAGARGVMVRKDFGKVAEVPLEWLEVVPGQRVRQRSVSPAIVFDITEEFIPQGEEMDLRVSVEITLHGFMRLMQPMMARVLRKTSERICVDLVRVLEAELAAPASMQKAG